MSLAPSGRKGVELSFQAMVVAAISIIVLVVLIFLFTRQSGNFAGSIDDCTGKGSGFSCKSSCGSEEVYYGKFGCDDGRVCCGPEESVLGR